MERITILGYEIEKGKIALDRTRLQPLLELVVPTTIIDSKQVQGLFAYYTRWIIDLSSKIKLLSDSKRFHLSEEAMVVFELLKKDLGDVTLMSMDEDQDFVVETDACNVAISATVNQNVKAVAFF